MTATNQQPSLSNEETLLEFMVGPLRFCAPVFQVEAIISPPKIIHLPLSNNVVAGCFDYQGRTATVLSMHNKFGLPFTIRENESHIVLAIVDGELKGFWVDQAIDIIQLASYDSKADFAANERKAYSNFLTSAEKIILQTSFPRLHDCDSSDLNWIVGSGAKKEEMLVTDEITNISDNDVSNEKPASDNVSTQETSTSTRQSEAVDADNNIVKDEHGQDTSTSENNLNVGADAQTSVESTTTKNTDKNSHLTEAAAKSSFTSEPLITSAGTAKSASMDKTSAAFSRNVNQSRHVANVFNNRQEAKTSTSFVNEASNSKYTSDRNVAKISSPAYSSSMPAQTSSYDTMAASEHNDHHKNTGLLIIMAAIWPLLALIIFSIYIIDTNSESPTAHSTKVISSPDSNKASVLEAIEPTIAADEFIDSAAVKMAPSENKSLNVVAEEDESMPRSSANARTFELHVNEQLDSEKYAITRFEPVAHHQESAPSEQQFTHRVVKGDTLWHITRRYLDNPHRYPELAAASHINNPHRIYPGDVIKIIVKRTANKN